MDKHYVVFFVVIGIIFTGAMGMTGMYLYEVYMIEEAHKTASKSPEVILFHEKYGIGEKRSINYDGGIVYEVSNGDDSIAFHYYTKTSNHFLVICGVIEAPDSYIVDTNVMYYLKNYNCFTDNYP